MSKVLLGALCGLIVGSLLGGLLAVVVHPKEPDDQTGNGWTSYPTLAESTGPVLWQHLVRSGSPPLSYLLFQGVLIGGGFGAVVGAIAAATRTIPHTLGHSKSG